jgi:DNA-binding transcriptional MerR regulator
MNIKSVVHLSGLSAHTLRAWERRYKVVQPSRSKGGQRLYSMTDVEKLKSLAFLVDRGHAIGTIAKLTTKQLEALTLEAPKANSQASQDNLLRHQESLLSALKLLDFDKLDRLILKARVDTPARVFVLDVVSPLLFAVGLLVEQNKLDIGQEHALSAILRNHLGDLLTQVQKLNPWTTAKHEDAPGFLFATAEGDLHEFGILLAAILTGSRGLSFRYLGPNMPAESLAKAAMNIGAKIVVLGSVQASTNRLACPMKEYVQLLSKLFKKSSYKGVSVWIGGYCDFDINSKKLSPGFKHCESLAQFDTELEKLVKNDEIT